MSEPRKVAIYQSQSDTAPASIDLTWDEIAELLSAPRETGCNPCKGHHCKDKDGQAWSPVELIPGTERANKNVLAITYAVIDLDNISDEQADQVAAQIEGYRFVVHSTHSHGLPGNALRLVLALSRPVRAGEWPAVFRAIVNALCLPADPSCKDLSRLYFLPSVSSHLADSFIYVRGEGEPLDVDMALSHGRATLPALADSPFEDLDTSDIADAVSIDLDSLRDRLRKVRTRKARRGDEKYNLLDRIIKGKAFCVPGHFKGSSSLPKGRGSSINQACSLIACALPAATPTAAALELLRPCFEKMDVEPQGLTSWLDDAAYSYERAMARRIERDTERDKVNQALKLRMANLAHVAGAVTQAAKEIESVQEHGIPDESAEDSILKNWRDLLLMNKEGGVKNVGENAFTILALDESVRNTITFDLVEKKIVIDGGPFANTPLAVLDTEISDWLMRHWDLNLNTSAVGERILRVAYENKIDPLRDYLEGLEWDGVDRISTFLETYAGARTRSGAGVDITNYVRTVGRKWLIGSVARALDPGCQMDTLLVMEGKQGKGKTSFCRIMGGQWKLETTLVLGDKDTMQLVSTAWIIELGELVSVRRSETNSLKSFLSKLTDKFRPPYGRVPEAFDRRCVFIGTTNDDAYLTDPTGNRRFWPVYCEQFDLISLRHDRDQIWAQAVQYYRNYLSERDKGTPDIANVWIWWMPEKEQIEADAQTEERIEASHFEVKIGEWWYGKSKRPAHVTTSEIAETVLRFTSDRVTRGVQTEIGIALLRLGFVKSRRTVSGRLQYIYEPSEALRDAEVGAQTHYLKLVATAKA